MDHRFKVPRAVVVWTIGLIGFLVAGRLLMLPFYLGEVTVPTLEEVNRYATTDIFLLGERESFIGLQQELDSGWLSYSFALGDMSVAEYFSAVEDAAAKRGWSMLRSDLEKAIYISPESEAFSRELVTVTYAESENRVVFDSRRPKANELLQ